MTACCSLTPSRPGFNTYLPLPEDRTGRRLAVPHPDTPRPPRGSSQHHATPCRSADEPPHTHARNRATYTGPETRVRGGRGLVRGAVLRGGVRRLVLEERLRRPVLGAPLPLRRGARGLRVAGAARANEGLERQRERPSHLGRRATLTPEAAATARPTHPPQDPEGRCAGRQAGPLTEAPQALRVPSPELHSDMDARVTARACAPGTAARGRARERALRGRP